MLRKLVPLAALAFALVTLGSASASGEPFFGAVIDQPGTVIRGGTYMFRYEAQADNITTLKVSLKLPGQMAMVKNRSSYYVLQNGQPTWTLRNVHSRTKGKAFTFRVKVLQSAKPGTKLILKFTPRVVASPLKYPPSFLEKVPVFVVKKGGSPQL
ncbi:hypothetical protein KW801_00845 [Candidatus Saccharibacteria bacterium]|nr:hypothetical protein [Candidatus Saccharibacteria bacterium]